MSTNRVVWSFALLTVGAAVLATKGSQGLQFAQKVFVTNTPSTAVPSTIVNSTQNPVLTDTDNAARNAVSFVQTAYGSGYNLAALVYTVPANYVLVVDQFSTSANGDDEASVATQYSLFGISGGDTVDALLPIEGRIDSLSPNAAVGNASKTDVVIPSGDSVLLTALQSSSADANCLVEFSLSGHLVYAPTANSAPTLTRGSQLTASQLGMYRHAIANQH